MLIVDAWTDLLVNNEKSSKPLTDDQLRTVMQRAFPARKRAASICRVSWIRCQYNTGTGFFKSRGRGTLRSHAYDAAGKQRTA
jgi:hypothetical protein